MSRHIRDGGCVHADPLPVHQVHLQQSHPRERSGAGSCCLHLRYAHSMFLCVFVCIFVCMYVCMCVCIYICAQCPRKCAEELSTALTVSSILTPSLSPSLTHSLIHPLFLYLLLGTFATRVPDLRPSIIELLQKSLADEDDEVRLKWNHEASLLLLCNGPFLLDSPPFDPYPMSFVSFIIISFSSCAHLTPSLLSSPPLCCALCQVRDRAAILLKAFATHTDEADLKCFFDEPMPM